jgi:hypothetical protein
MEYGNNKMDDKIREALERLEVPFDASHWQNFEEKLDAMDLNTGDTVDEAAFDANLSANLTNLETGAADWDSFVGKLEDAESQDPFDAIIAAGLTGAAASASADWGNFEEMLSAAEAADLTADDNIIDQKVQQNLEDYEAPYEPENWSLMRERIKEEFSLRRKLIRYRVAEVSVMILAIFTLFNYLPKNELGNFIIIEQVKERIKQKVSPQKTQEVTLQNTPIASAASADKNTKDNEIDLNIFSAEVQTNYVATGDAISIYAVQEVKTVSPLAILDTPLEVNDNVRLTPSNVPATEEKEEKKGLFAWMKKDQESELETSEDATMKSFLLEALENKKTKELSSNEEEILQASKVKLEHKNVRLAMFTSADLYGVYTPYNLSPKFVPTSTYSADVGGGILFDFQKNRLHIITGGAYMPKHYQPLEGAQVTGEFEIGYLKEELEKIQLDIVHVPLDLRYDFVQKPKWRLYGLAGASFNIVLGTVYDIETEVIAINEGVDREAVINSRETSSELETRDFPEGIAEGGRLPENIFLTAQLGFGAERFVTQRWSIFFEPVYQQQFSKMGIGPNENTFRTISLRLGAKATMFGK